MRNLESCKPPKPRLTIRTRNRWPRTKTVALLGMNHTGRCAMKSLLAICTSLPLMVGSAFAQMVTPSLEQKPTTVCPGESHSPGAMFSLDRGNGRGKINIKCAESDGTRDCVQAVLPVLSSGQGSGGVIFATT